MNKNVQAACIAKELIENKNRLVKGKITAAEWHNRVKEIYDKYKPDLNVWRKACKDEALQTTGIYIPMCDC